MAAEVPFLTAFIAGLISFLSPCVLPLVPPYLCYMAGVSLEKLTQQPEDIGLPGSDGAAVIASGADQLSQFRILGPAIAFVFGFSVVFVALGAGASTVGALLRSHMDLLATIAGVAIIFMGLHFLGVFRIGLLYREARFQSAGTGLAGSFAMGLAFAFGWTPCIGPVLGAILAMAGAQASVADGAILLGVYSAGLGVPFILAAMFVGPFMGFLGRFRRHLGTVEKAMGGLLVLTGILFLTGGMERFAFWLLETFPVLGTLG